MKCQSRYGLRQRHRSCNGVRLVTDRQTSIRRPVQAKGVGLHTGAEVGIQICPAPAYAGIVFRRVDLEGFEIPASPEYVAHVSYATALVHKGVLVATVEHLLAALYGCGVDNAIVEIDGFEVPIMDGSAAPFVELIQSAKVIELDAPRQYLRVLKKVEVVDEEKSMALSPAPALSIHCTIEFDHPLIGTQQREVVMADGAFAREIAPARTFGFLHQIESLRKMGLVRGGSLENAVVLTRDGLLNEEGLRFPDEFVRHKIMDLIGDLTLLGRPILGRVEAVRSGHAMHNALVTKLLRDAQAWKIIEAPLSQWRMADGGWRI
ncbi:MAG: UDP-3-O-acyl-N-acetylglucosamine deacetylase [Acidobacteria bacterium]|nr:UDP-3-O-acyl-N-acetylglucosamine deacetylase [Acidobacteriota bacterium]